MARHLPSFGARCSAVLFLLAATALAPACRGSGDELAADLPAAMGDLEGVRERGTLRILRPGRRPTAHLPRAAHSLEFERGLAEAYAASLGVEPVFVNVDSRHDMIAALLRGDGDLIAANMTATPEREQLVAFSVPVAVVREQLVARADDPIASLDELDGRTVAIRSSSSFAATVATLRETHPGLIVERVSEKMDTEEIIHRVAKGDYDLTVADSNLVQACLEYRDDIRAVADLTGERPIAWAVRPESEGLLEDLDKYLTRAQLTKRTLRHTGDFDAIAEGKVLRVLTTNALATYFLWRGELVGFEYELMREFAHQHGLRLEVVVPPDHDQLIPWLAEGRGDVVAASLSPTDGRRREGADFSQPYKFVSHMIVSRADDPIESMEQLTGRTVAVRPSSIYHSVLERLKASGIDLAIEMADESEETESLIHGVGRGAYDLTLADSHIVDIELGWRDDVRAAFAVDEEVPLAWAVRHSNPQLRAALDAFIKKEYRGLFYNIINKRYFENPRRIRTLAAGRTEVDFTPYDELVKRYAGEYGFDWRLIVSQMYEESRFDPGATSFAGALGLMQVLPRTGQEFGFDNLTDPEEGIHAGVQYLDWVRDRFEPELPVDVRIWFSLAAYNAGPGHVRDARRLAGSMGLNPNRWFGNVEQAMLLLSRADYARNAQHGYCRCREPVRYVREIRERYVAYVTTLHPFTGRTSL